MAGNKPIYIMISSHVENHSFYTVSNILGVGICGNGPTLTCAGTVNQEVVVSCYYCFCLGRVMYNNKGE